MSSELSMSSGQSSFRIHTTTSQKQARDVLELRAFARFVIVLNESGISDVVNNAALKENDRPYGKLVVVVGPVRNGGDGVLLEIAYNRSRPYQRVHKNRNQVFLQTRESARELEEWEIALVYPKIMDCLETILLETRAGWNHKGGWFTKKSDRSVEKGIQITVSKRDQWFVREMLLRHARYFAETQQKQFVAWINGRLAGPKYNRYPPKAYPQGVRKVIETLKGSRRTFQEPLLFETLLRSVARRVFLECALADILGVIHQRDEDAELVYGEEGIHLPRYKEHLFAYKTTDQPGSAKGTHAIGCVRFEILPERSWRRDIEGMEEPDRPPPQQELFPNAEETFGSAFVDDWESVTIERNDGDDDCPF